MEKPLFGKHDRPEKGDQRNASKSKRIMRRQWGAQPEKIKARRFERAERSQRYVWA
jgi:hypothetical protein